jgi:hypothetical protein
MTSSYRREYYLRHKNKFRKSLEKFYAENPAYRLFQSAKQRAKRDLIEFSISLEDIKIPEYCPYLSYKITHTRGEGRVATNASLDRIDSSKGYIPGNVQVICDLANRMKQNASELELLQFAKSVIKLHNLKNIASAAAKLNE